jgi:hypothetical protein
MGEREILKGEKLKFAKSASGVRRQSRRKDLRRREADF